MKIIFGLGNPGIKYWNTRHNIGRDVCRAFVKKHLFRIFKKGYKSRYVLFKPGNEEILIVLPQTFMNKSGEAVREILQAFKGDLSSILVIVDDFQIPLGSIRIRREGSSGGHNGLESICREAGNNFSRMRMGIGPKPQNEDIISFVLGRWKWKERKQINKLIQQGVKALDTFVLEGMEKAMSQHNSRSENAEGGK